MDIHSIMFGGIPNMEIESLRKYWDAFPGLREEIFGNISDNYARVIADDIEVQYLTLHLYLIILQNITLVLVDLENT